MALFIKAQGERRKTRGIKQKEQGARHRTQGTGRAHGTRRDNSKGIIQEVKDSRVY